jgi:cobalt/nickel transport system ATP-binding protein
MIAIENLSFTYPDGTRALRGVSARIGPGEKVGLVGPNGAGKSTLVHHLIGCHLPQDGRVAIAGTEVARPNLETIRRRIALVFQDPDDQLFLARLIDDTLFGPLNLGWNRETAQQAAESTLRLLGIWDLRDRPPFHLSAGQKRFAAIGTVLVMNPEILVLDEPTSDLDPRSRRRLIGLLNDLPKTLLVVSHDLDFVWDTCERVVLLADGAIAGDGPARSILQSRELLEANGLELPLRLQR